MVHATPTIRAFLWHRYPLSTSKTNAAGIAPSAPKMLILCVYNTAAYIQSQYALGGYAAPHCKQKDSLKLLLFAYLW